MALMIHDLSCIPYNIHEGGDQSGSVRLGDTLASMQIFVGIGWIREMDISWTFLGRDGDLIIAAAD